METAHDFFKEGAFYTGAEHRLEGPAREAQIEAASQELQSLVKKEFPRTGILEYAVLKAHLIIEHALTLYICSSSRTAIATGDMRFTFAQKLEVAYLLGLGADSPTLLPTIERLNKVRNQVAHKFQMDRAMLDEVLRINSADYETFSIETDRERIRCLRWLCVGLCGFISGFIIGTYTVVTNET